MVYAVIGVYAFVALVFICKAASYTDLIGQQAQGIYYEDLKQMRWERMIMLSLPYISTFLLMIVAPILYFLDHATEWLFGYSTGAEIYIVLAASWLVWGIAWLVVALCAVAFVGVIYYHWKVEERHVRQFEALKRNRDITQIAYTPSKWGRWVHVRRWNS